MKWHPEPARRPSPLYDTHGVTLRKTLESALDQGATALGVSLNHDQRKRLLDYLALLAKWTEVYNLTAIRDPQQMLIQHLLDSLAIIPHLSLPENATILDVGTGGGVPGIVLAIALPACRITLNDIVQKKIAFLTHVSAMLPLPNVTIVTGHVESLRPGIDVNTRFNAVIARAFAKLADFFAMTRHLLAPGASLWAMKGTRPDAEIAALNSSARVMQLVKLDVPLLNAERHLVQISA